MITDNRDQTYLYVVDEMKAHYRVRDTPSTYDLEMQDDTSVDPTNHPLWADWIKVSQTSSGCVGSLIITEQDTNPNDVFCRSYGTPLQALAAAILYNTDVYVAHCEAACEERDKPDRVDPFLIRCDPKDPWTFSFPQWTKDPVDTLIIMQTGSVHYVGVVPLASKSSATPGIVFQQAMQHLREQRSTTSTPTTSKKGQKRLRKGRSKDQKKRSRKEEGSRIMVGKQEFRRCLDDILGNQTLIVGREWPENVPPLGKFLLTSFTFWQL